MRARYAWFFLCVSLLSQPATAGEEEDELPPLELLGFIADFSDDEEGWTDPETIEDLFSMGEDGDGDTDGNGAPEAGEEQQDESAQQVQ